MEDMEDVNSPDGIIKVIVALMVAMVIVCSMLIPLVIDTSSEKVTNNNGVGTGVTLNRSAESSISSHFIITADDAGIHITGDYIIDADYDNQIIVLTDTMAVYVLDEELHYFDGISDMSIANVNIVIDMGMLNNVHYDWIVYPDYNGEYRSYVPPLSYELGDVIAFGLFNGEDIISYNDSVTFDTLDEEVSVQISRSGRGISQVYYTWED